MLFSWNEQGNKYTDVDHTNRDSTINHPESPVIPMMIGNPMKHPSIHWFIIMFPSKIASLRVYSEHPMFSHTQISYCSLRYLWIVYDCMHCVYTQSIYVYILDIMYEILYIICVYTIQYTYIYTCVYIIHTIYLLHINSYVCICNYIYTVLSGYLT